MSFGLCVQSAMDEGSIDRERGERAQAMWRDRSDQYERQGFRRDMAEALAGEDVKAAFRKEAGEKRHVYLAQIAAMRRQQQRVTEAFDSGRQRSFQRNSVEQMDYAARGMVRRFHGVLRDFLQTHHRDLMGNVTNPAQMRNFVKEMWGKSSGDPQAHALANGVKAALEDLRLMANERGANIGKLDIYGLPQSHNGAAIRRAGLNRWRDAIRDSIDWRRVEDPLTGRPMQSEDGPRPPKASQDSFLEEVFNNIVFGKEAREPVYGQPQGQAMYRALSQKRVLHFVDDEAWIAYNRQFGSGDPFKSLMTHVNHMARDIAAMTEFGPNPALGLDFQRQLAMNEAMKRGAVDDEPWLKGDGALARNMLRAWSGPAMPTGPIASRVATFMSSTRHVLTAAFLDRAILSSLSDRVSIRLAADMIGMNPDNVLTAHTRLMADHFAGKGEFLDDALRQQFIMDTMADPGATMARYQNEVPPAEIAEKLASGVMRLQGLSGWTDDARIAFQFSMGGHFAKYAGRPMREVDPALLREMERYGITEREWTRFADPERLYTAPNGATFLNPLHWRSTFDTPSREVDDLFMKMQGFVEAWTERAVPTQNLMARGVLDPVAWGLPPGSLPYEGLQSVTMFKSFVAAFTVNQVRNVMSLPTAKARAEHMAKLFVGMTILGGVALQLGEIVAGRDPMDMTNPEFIGKAALKGGGFGILGDIVVAGEAQFGGGFSSYLAGPLPQVATDAYSLTVGNAWEFATGQDTNFATEMGRTLRRYTPGAQLPFIGPALDRIIADQMVLALDPEAAEALAQTAQRNRTTFGRGEDWWLPGSAMPSRAPNLGAAFGQ